MSESIEVNKQTVKQLLESGKSNPFLIPEYQRKYSRGEDQIETLFDDIWEFSTKGDDNTESKRTYFLGCVVSFTNDNGEQEIIDGQQRITSLFLLLRAIYSLLEPSKDNSKKAQNFMSEIEPCIWEKDRFTGEVHFDKILIKSSVIGEEGNKTLHDILETGYADEKDDDNYSKNYIYLKNLLKRKSEEFPLDIYNFIYATLNQVIVFPIKAHSQDDALIIFSTLNDRGLPLSDSDIFKAKIYNSLKSSDSKKIFIERWRGIEEDANSIGESIQQLFYYYMFFLRAKDQDKVNTTPGLRKYFTEHENYLLDPLLLKDLEDILKLWTIIKLRKSDPDERWSSNIEILKSLDILSSYPNEFWKYPVIIYYLKYRTEDHFEGLFLNFLRKLIVDLLSQYLVTPTVNAVKGSILSLDVSIIENSHPNFTFKNVDQNIIENSIKTPPKNVVRMLLKILAYHDQKTLLPEKWEIEHILPINWQPTFFSNVPEEEINNKVEHLGNKVPFEKRLNIIASNGYFDKKKLEYGKSSIKIVNDLCKYSKWDLDDIVVRDAKIVETINKIFENWNDDYSETQKGNESTSIV